MPPGNLAASPSTSCGPAASSSYAANVAAEQAWRRATELQPEHVGVAAIGVRCALRLQLGEDVWARALRLRSLAPDLPLARYWYAIAAAATKRDAIAYEEVAAISRMDPTGDWPLHAAAEVDLVISGRKRRLGEGRGGGGGAARSATHSIKAPTRSACGRRRSVRWRRA